MRVFLFLILSLALSLPAAAEDDDEALQPRMAVTGEGSVDVAPDMATVRLGVLAEAVEAGDAIGEMNRAMTDVLDRIAASGIEGRDVQTADLSVQPRWDHRPNGEAPRIAGFQARTTVTVRVRDLDRLGEVLDAVARDGANLFEGVSFGLQDPEPVRDAARRAAVADARRKAALYAEAAGVGLGPLLRLSEAGGAPPEPMPLARMEMAMAADAMPVAGGELTVTAWVTLVYGLEAR